MDDIFTNIMARYVRPSVVASCKNILKLDHEDRKNQVDRDDLDIGFKTRQHLDSLKKKSELSEAQETKFIHGKSISDNSYSINLFQVFQVFFIH